MSNQDIRYNPSEFENKWQTAWTEAGAFKTRGEGEPYYVLEMFPYPSGSLHMGHVRNYTIGDVFARYLRMQGKDVLHPMGWDALGLPAENQAIKEKVAPQIRTPKNIEQMKVQMTQLGLAYDWSREIGTFLPEYYRWNQWFFIKMLEKGLIYRRQSTVNWCPGCQTILANEQVREGDICWRGHEGVTKKQVPEWAFKITDYAEELLQDLDQLKEWPDRIVTQQRNWLGKSIGAKVFFPLVGRDEKVEIFTTRVDTIYGCTYVVLAPEHPMALTLTTDEHKEEVKAFIETQRNIDKIERMAEGVPKEGVFTGAMAVNPYTGEEVPVWLANFVLADYGTGAVMSVPAHDQRDFEFAHKYDLEIKAVIGPADGTQLPEPLDAAHTVDGILFNSAQFSDKTSEEARAAMAEFAATENFGEKATTWHLRDWGFSRQRYWGTPIPIIYCDEHGAVPAKEEDLPIILPDFKDIELGKAGGAPLSRLPSFYETTCPICNAPAKRETETMDTFVDSAWYFARFISPKHTLAPFDKAEAERFLPVDVYVGGPEHAVMHLLYFRFWTKVMRDMGMVTIDEPVKRLITQGMVNSTAYKCPTHGYLPAKDYRDQKDDALKCKECGKVLSVGVEKMSKSKYNGIDPMDLIERYGADVARLYTLFAAPPQKDLEWNPDGVEGIYRFVTRVYKLAAIQQERIKGAQAPTSMDGLKGADKAVRQALHRTLAKATEEIGERIHFNTAIAAMMELLNTLSEHKMNDGKSVSPGVAREVILNLSKILSPLAPHLAEEIWSMAGGEGLVAVSPWPVIDPEAVKQESMKIAVQVNGKLRAQIEIPADSDQAMALETAKADAKVARYLEEGTLRKEIYIKGRLVNLVVSQ